MCDKDILNVILEKVSKLEIILVGNGNPENGLIVKVDRLIIAQQSRSKFYWTLIGNFLTPATITLFLLYLLK